MSTTEARTEPFEEVQRIVEEAIAGAGAEYHTGILAVEISERIRLERPDLWGAWTDAMALDALKTAIGRTRGLQRRPRSVFRRGGYDLTEEVDGSHTQRRFGDMVRADLDYVARRYMRLSVTCKTRAERVRALYERLPDETTLVREVIPQEDVAAIFD